MSNIKLKCVISIYHNFDQIFQTIWKYDQKQEQPFSRYLFLFLKNVNCDNKQFILEFALNLMNQNMCKNLFMKIT